MIAVTRYVNDGKEKFQSHEMHIDSHQIQPSGSGDYYGSMDLTAYGSSREEATAHLRAALRHLIHDAQETLASLPAPELPDPPAVSTEIDAVFEERLAAAISYGQRRFTESRDFELQRKIFSTTFKQQLIDAASKGERRHTLFVSPAMRKTAEEILAHCAEIHKGFAYETVCPDKSIRAVDFNVSFPTP